MPTIILDSTFDQNNAKNNADELFREMFVYKVDGERADIMAFIQHDGTVVAYNMDENHYFNEKAGECLYDKKIPEDIAVKLVEMAEQQIQADYENSKMLSAIKNKPFFEKD